jgi:hypothetical protein
MDLDLLLPHRRKVNQELQKNLQKNLLRLNLFFLRSEQAAYYIEGFSFAQV